MNFVDDVFDDPESNLALDEALLLEAEEIGGEVLRLWEQPTPAVILGSACRIHEDVDVEACKRAGIPIHRRASGGGTVVLGPGCLVYSLVLNYERSPMLAQIRSSYEWILDQVAAALGLDGVTQQGISDGVLAERKFSGTAQQRKRSHLLHHGTLLYDFDITMMRTCLRMPTRRPEYREGRPHEEFVANLPMSGDELRERLWRLWVDGEKVDTIPRERVEELVREKYGQRSWTFRL